MGEGVGVRVRVRVWVIYSSHNHTQTYTPTHQRNESIQSMNMQNSIPITLDDIEKIITKAYHQTESIINDLKLTGTLKNNSLNDWRIFSLLV